MYFEEYRKARQMGQKEAKLCQSRGGSPYLPVLDEILAAEETCGEVSLGLADIPIELIVGVFPQFLPLDVRGLRVCQQMGLFMQGPYGRGNHGPHQGL